MKVELSNGAITATATDQHKIDTRAIDVTVHTTERETEVDATFWEEERNRGEYVSFRVTIKEAWFESPEEDETGRVALAGNLTQFLSLDQARDQVRALNNVLRLHTSAGPQLEAVEHSVDLEDLAQTINDSLSASFELNDVGFADRILDALKYEFTGQSLHMREDQ